MFSPRKVTNRLAAPLALAFLLAVNVCSTHAQPGVSTTGDTWIFFFDEQGNGAISVNGSPIMPNPGFLGLDPTTGLFTLIYPLPAPIFTGAVLVLDVFQEVGDAINFFNDGTIGFMAFYSDNPEEMDGDLADVNGVPKFNTDFRVQEDGLGGSFIWLPALGFLYIGDSDPFDPPPS